MTTKVHKVRFYCPKPRSINCVSYNKVTKLVALARDDASIEVWDMSYAPLLIKFIPGVENGSIEALGWVNDRLLSTGLGGSLIEWDLEKLVLKKTVLLTGYAAWCLDINPASTLIAVGTEQGYINLFSIENDDIVYQKLFDKQEGRILCCKFDKTGNILATGSVDTIRIWNVETGQALTRISTKRRGREVIVWSLGMLPDNVLVSGETGGRLTFWDMNTGDQIESFMTHKSDILSIVVSESEDSLYCSGIDPVIVNFVRVPTGKHSKTGCQWAKNLQRHIHEHDVRSLALQGDKLISAGVDGYLTLSSFPPKWVMRIPPLLPHPRSSVAANKKLLLLRYNNHLEVWKLGSYATNNKGKPIYSNSNKNSSKDSNGSIPNGIEPEPTVAVNKGNNQEKNASLQIVDNPLKLVSVETKGHKAIRCCDISPNGEVIIYATDSNIRMLKLETDDSDNANTSLSKISISGLSVSSCYKAAFTPDSRHLLVHSVGTVYMLQVDPAAGATVVQTIATSHYLKASTLLHLQVSERSEEGNTYLIAGDTSGAVGVWLRTSGVKFEHHVTLPRYQCLPSALTVVGDQVIVVYVDQKVIEYDLVNKKLVVRLSATLPPAWFGRSAAVSAVSAHPQRKNALVFHDETSLWIVDKNKGQNENCEPASKKKLAAGDCNASLRVVPVKYLSGFHWVCADEAVAVETQPVDIVSQLPEVLRQKRPPVL